MRLAKIGKTYVNPLHIQGVCLSQADCTAGGLQPLEGDHPTVVSMTGTGPAGGSLYDTVEPILKVVAEINAALVEDAPTTEVKTQV